MCAQSSSAAPTSCATTPTVKYDRRGNLLTDGTATYSYDAADRLSQTLLPKPANPATLSYSYDADGRRIAQKVGSTSTNYLWDELSAYGDVVAETTGGTTTNYTVGWVKGEGGTCGCTSCGCTQGGGCKVGAGEVLAQTRGTTPNYMLHDGQGNVRTLTGGAGTITDGYSYDAYGSLRSSSGTTANVYRYTGQQFDIASGLYSLRARYYNPSAGSFLSRDTWGFDTRNSADLNRYAYVHDNPTNAFDPSGHTIVLQFSLALRAIPLPISGALAGVGIKVAAKILVIAASLVIVADIQGSGDPPGNPCKDVNTPAIELTNQLFAKGAPDLGGILSWCQAGKSGDPMGPEGFARLSTPASAAKWIAIYKAAGVTKELLQLWRNAYTCESNNPKNLSAPCRVKLMEQLLNLWDTPWG